MSNEGRRSGQTDPSRSRRPVPPERPDYHHSLTKYTESVVSFSRAKALSEPPHHRAEHALNAAARAAELAASHTTNTPPYNAWWRLHLKWAHTATAAELDDAEQFATQHSTRHRTFTRSTPNHSQASVTEALQGTDYTPAINTPAPGDESA